MESRKCFARRACRSDPPDPGSGMERPFGPGRNLLNKKFRIGVGFLTTPFRLCLAFALESLPIRDPESGCYMLR